MRVTVLYRCECVTCVVVVETRLQASSIEDLLGVGSAVEGLPHEPKQRQAWQPQGTRANEHPCH